MSFEEALKTEKIRNIMAPRGIEVQGSTPYQAVVEELQKQEKFCAVILKGKKVVGIFTERDALKRGLLGNADPKAPIEQLMTKNPTVVHPEDTLALAIGKLKGGKYRHLPVVNEKQEFVGLVSVRDIVFFLSENYPYDIFNQPPDPHKVSYAPEGA